MMIIRHSYEVPKESPTLEKTKSCTLRWLITHKDGAKGYAMRLFELGSNGQIPLHSHEDTEHEIFIIAGEGFLNDGKQDIRVKKDDVIFIQAGDKHSFRNDTDKPFKFICVIPIR
jgi:quercetin dioxygenase-like cupin family protein